MRKVKYSVGASLDGYIATVDGSVDWLNRAAANAKGEDFGMTEFFAGIDTVLMGRKTYEHALEMGMAKSGYPGVRNIVLSRSLPSGVRDGVEFVSRDLDRLIEAIRKKPGKDIWLCGGGELARQALQLQLVDEITLGVAPVLIGGGLPTFPAGFPETAVELIECNQYKSGFVGLTYKVVTKGIPKAARSSPKKTKESAGRNADRRKI